MLFFFFISFFSTLSRFPHFCFRGKRRFCSRPHRTVWTYFFYDFFMEHDGAKDSYIPSIEKKKRKGKGGYFWGPRFGLNFLADGQRSPKLGSGILKINRNDKLKITPFSTIRIDRIPPPPPPPVGQGRLSMAAVRGWGLTKAARVGLKSIDNLNNR